MSVLIEREELIIDLTAPPCDCGRKGCCGCKDCAHWEQLLERHHPPYIGRCKSPKWIHLLDLKQAFNFPTDAVGYTTLMGSQHVYLITGSEFQCKHFILKETGRNEEELSREN